MTQYLPPNLLALFAPREPIPFLPPPDKLPHQKKTLGYTGVSDFLHIFEDPSDTPDPVKIETREERQERKRRDKAEQVAYKLELDIAQWAPHNSTSSTTDPYKTLFVARVNYDTSESKIRREFEVYGPIRNISVTHDEFSGKPRGYAFIEYEHERDMHSAYKHADGKKVDGRRVLVDVERGRTVKGWLPRRLGGGIGSTRRGGPDVNVKHSGREEPRGERGEDRYADRDRERPERPERRRSRSRSRERRRRSRSRERHRGDRGDRHKRERSRERVRDRDREPVLNNEKPDVPDSIKAEIPPEGERKERRRSRSRDRDRRRRRSRSRDRERRRDRGDRDRDMRRPERGADRDERVIVKQEENPLPPENADAQDGFNNNNNEYEASEFNNYGDEGSNYNY